MTPLVSQNLNIYVKNSRPTPLQSVSDTPLEGRWDPNLAAFFIYGTVVVVVVVVVVV